MPTLTANPSTGDRVTFKGWQYEYTGDRWENRGFVSYYNPFAGFSGPYGPVNSDLSGVSSWRYPANGTDYSPFARASSDSPNIWGTGNTDAHGVWGLDFRGIQASNITTAALADPNQSPDVVYSDFLGGGNNQMWLNQGFANVEASPFYNKTWTGDPPFDADGVEFGDTAAGASFAVFTGPDRDVDVTAASTANRDAGGAWQAGERVSANSNVRGLTYQGTSGAGGIASGVYLDEITKFSFSPRDDATGYFTDTTATYEVIKGDYLGHVWTSGTTFQTVISDADVVSASGQVSLAIAYEIYFKKISA